MCCRAMDVNSSNLSIFGNSSKVWAVFCASSNGASSNETTLLSHHITVWNEIYITLFVYRHTPILYTSWLSYAHRPSCTTKREDNNLLLSLSINYQSSVGAKSFHSLWSLFFVWHVYYFCILKSLRRHDKRLQICVAFNWGRWLLDMHQKNNV